MTGGADRGGDSSLRRMRQTGATSMGRPLLILGASLAALEVADAAAAQGLEVAGFLAPSNGEGAPAPLAGLPVLASEQADGLAASHLLVCGLDAPERRREVERAAALGFRFATVCHPSAYVAPTALLEEGCVVGAGACVSGYTRIGPHALLCPGALIGHHTIVAAHAVVGQGASVAGSCLVEEEAWLGAGARVIHRLRIGRGALVHPGAVVLADVGAGCAVTGVPARPLA